MSNDLKIFNKCLKSNRPVDPKTNIFLFKPEVMSSIINIL